MKTVLVVAYGGGHINCLLPVIRCLRARSDVRVEVLALTTAAAVCAEQGIPYRRISDFPGVQDARSIAHGQRLAAGATPHPAVPLAESVAYLGANYRDLEDACGVVEAAKRYAVEGRASFLPVGTLAGILREISPDVVLVTSAPRAERAAVLAARQLHIPSVVVVDLFALTELDVLKDPTFCDVICVLAGSVRDRLVAAGRPLEHIQITGNPVFDRLADPLLGTRGLDLRSVRLWNHQRVITWASQPEPTDPQLPRRIEATLIAALETNPAWHLVIRPHPSDIYPPPAPHPRLTLSTRADDLHTLLAASDVVVTMTSTVGLEAVLLGKPLVTWDLSENTQFCPYSAMGFSRGVTELSQLAVAVNEVALSGFAMPELPIIGRACTAVVAVVERYLHSHESVRPVAAE